MPTRTMNEAVITGTPARKILDLSAIRATLAARGFPDLAQYHITGRFVCRATEDQYSTFCIQRWLPRYKSILVACSIHMTLFSSNVLFGWTWYANTTVETNVALRSGIYELKPWAHIEHVGLCTLTWLMMLATYDISRSSGRGGGGMPHSRVRRYRLLMTILLILSILITNLPTAVVQCTHTGGNPTLQDASHEERERALADFGSVSAIRQAPFVIIMNALPFHMPIVWSALQIILSWYRSKTLFALSFGVPVPFSPLSSVFLLLACALVSHMTSNYSRALFIVATIGTRRVRQLESEKEMLHHEVIRLEEVLRLEQIEHGRMRHQDEGVRESPRVTRSLSF